MLAALGPAAGEGLAPQLAASRQRARSRRPSLPHAPAVHGAANMEDAPDPAAGTETVSLVSSFMALLLVGAYACIDKTDGAGIRDGNGYPRPVYPWVKTLLGYGFGGFCPPRVRYWVITSPIG